MKPDRVPDIISDYLATIGKKGGSSKSEKKRLASKRNIEKRWAKHRKAK